MERDKEATGGIEILECEGYKMFRGTATIMPVISTLPPFEVSGVWLYKPEFDCWYCNDRSYPAEIVKIGSRHG